MARIYGVPTKALNQAVKRNRGKFPGDFVFEVSLGEAENSFVTLAGCGSFAGLGAVVASAVVCESSIFGGFPESNFDAHGLS